MKIFGREPAAWLALIAVAVKLSTAFGLDLTDGQQAVINAVAAALGFVQAALALAVGFGLHWSPEQQAVVMSFVSALVAMWTRTQVTAPVPPVSKPTLAPAPPAG
jgi:hypothetical protein